ncbi:transglycosylase [Staphylococcus hominis]|uniref:aggregation-promoting factor C-terminal-like domain-containing protein n=1 Tax=Staphylococcus hominis TaxID=1290 RepID=UPI0009000C2E|nr:transglycosylase [Staphylococcus hominis]OJH01313.1 transglycosylase [Staphylococcus hominis]
MKKSIFALMTMLSLGAAGLESGQAHAEEVSTSPSQQHQYQYHQSHTSNLNISSSNTTTSSTSSSTQSVYQRFLAAGGTEEMWEKIVLPESGGNPNASNGQYHGLGQTNQSWGYGSVETQTKGMIQYTKERYGSIGAAIRFRESNGWW